MRIDSKKIKNNQNFYIKRIILLATAIFSRPNLVQVIIAHYDKRAISGYILEERFRQALQEFAPKVALLAPKTCLFVIPRNEESLAGKKRDSSFLGMTNLEQIPEEPSGIVFFSYF